MVKRRPVCSCQKQHALAGKRAFVRALPREGLELNRNCLVSAVEHLPRIVHCLQNHIETRPPAPLSPGSSWMQRCCHALQCNTVLSCITMPARCDGITKQSRFTIPMTMLLSTSATRFCYAVTAALPIMCCLATAQHAVKRERSTVLRHHQQVRIR